MRDIPFHVVDEAFIGGVEHDQHAAVSGVPYPFAQARAIQRGSGGVVGRTEIEHIRRFFGRRGYKAVFRRAGQVTDAAPALFRPCSSTARHAVGIHIDRIDGVGDGYVHVRGEQLLKVAEIALRAVADENVVRAYADAARGVFQRYRFAQKGVALFRAVAVKALRAAHVVHGGVQRPDDRRNERLGHIADTHADDVSAGVSLAERRNPMGNFREQIGLAHTGIMGIDAQHVSSFFME